MIRSRMLWGLAYNIVLVLCCALALLWGGRPERVGAGLMFAGSMLSWAALEFFATFHASVESGILIVDIALLAGLGTLALASDRYWPLWATGFHLVGLTTHVAVLADRAIAPLAYAHALGLWSYLTLFSLALGSSAVRRRRRSANSISPLFSKRSGRPKRTRSPPR